MSQDKPVAPPTPEQLAELKAKLLADPNTKKIAESVNLPFDEYVEQVMKYLANPGLEPTLYMASDEDLKNELGYQAPDVEKIEAFVVEHAEAQEISSKSKFADPNSQRERVSGKLPVPPAATAQPDEVKQDLKAELERQRTSGKHKKF